MIPTPDQFMAKLQASLEDAAAFDRAAAAAGQTRRQHVEAILKTMKSSPAPIPRAAAPVAIAKPATNGTMTAASFAKVQTTIIRSEFDKLAENDKSRFFKEGGKLIDDPKPAKPLSIGGRLTREGLKALSPQARNSYFSAGGKLAE